MAKEFSLRIDEIKLALDPVKMARGAHKVFSANTPIRSGNARSKTTLSQDTIEAAYPYATRLDQGYSKQRPNGMTKPTIQFLQDYVRKQGK